MTPHTSSSKTETLCCDIYRRLLWSQTDGWFSCRSLWITREIQRNSVESLQSETFYVTKITRKRHKKEIGANCAQNDPKKHENDIKSSLSRNIHVCCINVQIKRFKVNVQITSCGCFTIKALQEEKSEINILQYVCKKWKMELSIETVGAVDGLSVKCRFRSAFPLL